MKCYSIPFKVPGSRTDRELLNYYCCEAADSLSRFSETTLWTRIILQRSEYQPVIRNAVVALSCLYRDYVRLGSSELELSAKHLQLITRSHSQLRAHLVRDASAEVALLCSLIFYTFECLVGNSQQALWHLDQGLTLFQKCQFDYSHPDGESTHSQLRSIFSRLDVHASIYSPERMPILRLSLPGQVPEELPVLPDQPLSLTDLEYALTVLQNRTVWHLMTFVEYKENPDLEMPSYALFERSHLETQLQKMEQRIMELAMDPFMYSNALQSQRLALIHSETLIFHAVLLENIPQSSSEANARFDAALTQISILLSNPSSEAVPAPATGIREFTLSTNLIAMLYFICVKTENGRILRRALSLLENFLSEARDGLWNASTAVTVVKTMLSEMRNYGDTCGNEEEDAIVRLEDVGDGIVDVDGGLDEAFKMLQIDQCAKWRHGVKEDNVLVVEGYVQNLE